MPSSEQPPDNRGDKPASLPRRVPSSVETGTSQNTSPPGPGESPPRPPGGHKTTSLLISVGIPALVGLLGVAALGWWLWSEQHGEELEPRVPGVEVAIQSEPGGAASPPPAPEDQAERPTPAATLPSGAAQTTSPAAASAAVAIQGQWPRFRGANFDNISTETVPLARSWGPQGPPVLWSVTLGEGHAGPAVSRSRVYVLDYDHAAQADTLRCFSLADGSQLWQNSYPVSVKRNHGMSRTVPAISGQYVVTLGPKCHVTCWDADTGAIKWQIDLVSRYGATVPDWYAGQCLLIDGGRVIIATGGKALMIAVDLASGKEIWKTPNPKGWQMSHSSVAPIAFNSRLMYVCCFKEGVAGVAASDGSLLWDTTEWRVSTATIPTPLPVAEGRMLLAGGYNAGSAMLQLSEDSGKLRSEIVYRLPANVFSSHQHTPIIYNGYIYGVIQDGQLVCLDPAGEQVWASGHTRRFGLGPYIMAQGLLYVLSDQGVLTLVEATPSGYKQLAQAKVLSGPEAFGAMALVGGRLLARDFTKMVCLDVSG